MWIFTKTGFYSVVAHRDLPETFLVRARTREDLVDLIDGVGIERIEENPTADYRWRLAINKYEFMALMADQMNALDYSTNVKGQLDKGDHRRHHAMLRVWDAMMDLQFPDDHSLSSEIAGGPDQSDQ